jgi:Integrase core domain
MQTGEDWDGDDVAGLLHSAARGGVFAQGQVGANVIVVSRVCGKNLPQVRLAKDQHSVQALSAHGADQTLHIRVLPWRSRQNRAVPDAHGPQPRCKDMPVGMIIVAYQIGRRRGPGKGLSNLPSRHPTAGWLAQQIVEAFPWDTAPNYLVRDNDRSYGQVFLNRLRSTGIRDRPISPRSPWQNPYVEWLIGTLRRECLDHVLILGEWHLRRVLKSYARYYNTTRTHLGSDKDTPLPRPEQRSGTIVSTPILSGLHHCYART